MFLTDAAKSEVSKWRAKLIEETPKFGVFKSKGWFGRNLFSVYQVSKDRWTHFCDQSTAHKFIIQES